MSWHSESNGVEREAGRGGTSGDELDVVWQHVARSTFEARPVGRKHQSRPHAFEHLSQRRELLRLQRIGGSNRRVRDPDVHRGQRNQSMVDAVAGEDQDRSVDGQWRESSACAILRTSASASP
jgi:hypothetical protein